MGDSVNAEMFIRRPPGEVFAAFANPQTIRKFWLRDTSGPLAPGARVTWHFMVPGATADVVVTGFEAPRRIGFDWPGGMHVELLFGPFAGFSTKFLKNGSLLDLPKSIGIDNALPMIFLFDLHLQESLLFLYAFERTQYVTRKVQKKTA